MTDMQGTRIHMVGIGGIGMSALAQYFVAQGAYVTGSDREASPATRMLENRGIVVVIGQSADNVGSGIELLVYSDAVGENNPERVRAKELGIVQRSYFDALGEIASTKRTVAIAGTHGKTTTTAMLGKILTDLGADPTVIVGSIVSEWGSNFRAGKSTLFVVEACEYRNHFLTFKPEVLVITNIEFDHTDFFKSLEEVRHAFADAAAGAKKVVTAKEYMQESVPELLVPGDFNKENAQAAKAAARVLVPGASEQNIDASLAAYRGTWRRFEYKGTLPKGAQLYDDYAHHPTAIERTVAAARQKFPDKKIVLAFHPHLYSRTRDLFSDFAKTLATADRVFLLPVYAARETPDPNFSHEALARAANKLGGHVVAVSGMEETVQKLLELGTDTVVFTMGAGDVYKAGEEALALRVEKDLP